MGQTHKLIYKRKNVFFLNNPVSTVFYPVFHENMQIGPFLQRKQDKCKDSDRIMQHFQSLSFIAVMLVEG